MNHSIIARPRKAVPAVVEANRPLDPTTLETILVERVSRKARVPAVVAKAIVALAGLGAREVRHG